MKKNTIIIIATVVILLIIGAAYYYENYIVRSSNMGAYPEVAELLKEDPKKALDYCDKNATIDSFDPAADCLAEILCAADELNKGKELCEAGALQYPPKDEGEKQKIIGDCIETIKLVCKNPKEAINLCKNRECFMALSAISLKKGYTEIAKEACHKINDSGKEDCYSNLVYSLAKMNKTYNEMLKICDSYDSEDFDYRFCGGDISSMKRCPNDEIIKHRYNVKFDCYILSAKLTSKTDKTKAKEICNKIPVEGIDYKQDCLNNCIKDNQTEESCNEMCRYGSKNKRDECLSLVL